MIKPLCRCLLSLVFGVLLLCFKYFAFLVLVGVFRLVLGCFIAPYIRLNNSV